jgi:hypothetical protein
MQNGDPLPFATVGIKGKNIGAQTNFEGIFTIRAKELGDSLYVSTVGYKTRTKAIDKKSANQTIDFQLAGEAKSLDEVIVYSEKILPLKFFVNFVRIVKKMTASI